MGTAFIRGDYIQKGMVFWYDPHPEINKNNVPKLYVKGREIIDHLIKGHRPWVVVSSNEINLRSNLVQIMPIHSSNVRRDNPNRVYFRMEDRYEESCIMCEQIRTVNAQELTDYYGLLSSEIMSQVDEKFTKILGIKQQEYSEDEMLGKLLKKLLGNVKDSIQNIIENPSELSNNEVYNQYSNVDNSGVTRIINRHNTQYESNDLPENDNSDNEVIQESSGKAFRFRGKKHLDYVVPVRNTNEKRHRWTTSEMLIFLQDCSEYDVGTLYRKYGCENRKQLAQLRNYILKKVNKG